MCNGIKQMNRAIYILFLLSLSMTTYGQSPHKNLRKGDKYYFQKDYSQAEEEYRKALQNDEKSVSANHNLGNSLYQQKRFAEAAKYFESAALTSTNEDNKAKSYHNLGNAYLSQMSTVETPAQGQEVLQKSIDAFKQSLKHNPNDDATRYNLAYAQSLFQQQQQQQQQEQEKQNGQQNQENSSSSSSEGGNNEQKENKQEPKPQPTEQKMSKSEAERLIQIMEEQERRVQEKMNKKQQQTNPTGKDW